MNAPIWVAWIVVGVLVAVSIFLLTGKGAFIIAGYNLMSKEQKKRYNAKKLSLVVGSGFTILTIITGIFTLYEFELPTAIDWIVPWGMLGTLAIIIILANTLCKAKAEEEV